MDGLPLPFLGIVSVPNPLTNSNLPYASSPMSMGFTLLRTFHAVAERRGFTAAAHALGIGQPTVTTQVKELETSYGVELFRRQGRRVELTDAGAALFEITKRL